MLLFLKKVCNFSERYLRVFRVAHGIWGCTTSVTSGGKVDQLGTMSGHLPAWAVIYRICCCNLSCSSQPSLVEISVCAILQIPILSSITGGKTKYIMQLALYIGILKHYVCLITFPLNKETQYMQMYEEASIVRLPLCLRALYEVSVITGAFVSNSISPKIATITSKRKTKPCQYQQHKWTQGCSRALVVKMAGREMVSWHIKCVLLGWGFLWERIITPLRNPVGVTLQHNGANFYASPWSTSS